MYTKLVSQVLFPVHEFLKGHATTRVHRELERSQWASRDTILRDQLTRLQALLTKAGSNVPYFQRLFRTCGFDPTRLSRLEDLASIPFLTKNLIRENFDDLRSAEAKGLAPFNTGGSTGEPLQFLIGRERVAHDVAAKWRATRWWNVDIGDREVVLWGSPIELGAQDRLRALRDWLLRSRLLSAFDMSDENVDGFINTIREFRPKMLFGYPSAFDHLCRHARRRNIPLKDVGVETAFVTAERLYDHQRENIEESFDCRVANGYGGRDAGFVAHECPDGGMHITAEDIVVEIVGDDGRAVPSGGAGEIVVTHLASGDFPFIRYRTGDIAVLDDGVCSCGRGLPLVKEIQGRSTDFVVAQDGSVLHGLALIYVVRELPEVEQFRIVQESLCHTRVLLVAPRRLSDRSRKKLRDGIKQRLGSGVTVSLEQVDEMPMIRSGKHRYVVSNVDRFKEATKTALECMGARA